MIDEREYEQWKEKHPSESFSAWIRSKMRQDILKNEPLEARLSKLCIVYKNETDQAVIETNLAYWCEGIKADYQVDWTPEKLRRVLIAFGEAPLPPRAPPSPEAVQ